VKVRLALALVLLLLGLVAAPAVRADSDPPSDVLISQSVYFPYSPPVSRGIGAILTRVVDDAKKAGYPVRVAVVSSDYDLGSIPDLLGRPQSYAPFLQREISFNRRRPLLVVMDGGFGTADAGSGAAAALASLPKPAGGSDALARSAILAVPKLAGAAGHRVATPVLPAAAGKGGGKSGTPWWVFVAPLVLVGLAVAVLTRRRGPDEEAEAATGPPPA
jgi:hypothetical protein